jgi:acetylglutamate kinase
MSELPLSAEAFAIAVERVAAHGERPVVVKLGGSAMEDPTATDTCLRSVAILYRLGVRQVLVHGGGKPIDRAMAEAGLTPKKVAGRRYTDDATLAIVLDVLLNQINTSLRTRLKDLGVDGALVNHTLSGNKLTITDSNGQQIDLGRVGRVTIVRADELLERLNRRILPIIPSLALDSNGSWLNVNADTAASAVAGALQADKAIFLTDTPGVLRDRADPKSLIPKLTEVEARELIARGVIDGGMVPKVEACFEALAAGAKSALILDGRVPFSLLDVFLRDQFRGTAIAR